MTVEGDGETTMAHHQSCPFEYAWDVAGELGAHCICGPPKHIGYPRRVCNWCWKPVSMCKYGRQKMEHPAWIAAEEDRERVALFQRLRQ